MVRLLNLVQVDFIPILDGVVIVRRYYELSWQLEAFGSFIVSACRPFTTSHFDSFNRVQPETDRQQR